jgi:anthranilate phosphoribosyltransferase
VIRPGDFGIKPAPAAGITIETADQAVAVLCAALGGESGAAHDVLSLNGGAAIYVGGLTSSLAEGVEAARAVLRQGLALGTLERMRAASRKEN